MIKHFCDRCGAEVSRLVNRTYVRCMDGGGEVPSGIKPEYLLCHKCMEELEKFLEGKR